MISSYLRTWNKFLLLFYLLFEQTLHSMIHPNKTLFCSETKRIRIVTLLALPWKHLTEKIIIKPEDSDHSTPYCIYNRFLHWWLWRNLGIPTYGSCCAKPLKQREKGRGEENKGSRENGKDWCLERDKLPAKEEIFLPAGYRLALLCGRRRGGGRRGAVFLFLSRKDA